MSNSTFSNIINYGSGRNFGAIIRCWTVNLTGYNNWFVNINTDYGYNGGVFSIERSDQIIFELEKCFFVNVKCYGNGGVIFTNQLINFRFL
jgi:hypothetical protein